MIRVILCAHNGVQFLEAQLASIMEQQRPVDVVHLFDFASGDGTPDLARRLAARWPRLEVNEVDHAPGVTLSFFHAFRQIEPLCGQGDLIFLSDQDDVWLPQKVAAICARLEAERTDAGERLLLFHDVQICDDALRTIEPSYYRNRRYHAPHRIDRKLLLITNPVIGHTIALTKPLLSLAVASLRPRHYAMHDWALVLLAEYTGKLVYVDAALGLYRQHAGNVLGAASRRSLAEYIRRAGRLARLADEQVRAFEKDVATAASIAGLAQPGSLLPGRAPFGWRLAATFLLNGPSLGHRLTAVFPIARMLRPRRRRTLASE